MAREEDWKVTGWIVLYEGNAFGGPNGSWRGKKPAETRASSAPGAQAKPVYEARRLETAIANAAKKG